jgi:hypothetical protein
MIKRVKERRKRKEKERKPMNELPGCRKDSIAPIAKARGRSQSRSVFLRFMRRDFTLIAYCNYRFVGRDIILTTIGSVV